MEKTAYMYQMLFGVVACAAAGGVAYRCCVRRQREPQPDPPASESGSAQSQTAASEGKGSPDASPSARGQRRAAGPCPRPRIPASAGADCDDTNVDDQDAPATPRAAPPAHRCGTAHRGGPALAPPEAAAEGGPAAAPQGREGAPADAPAPGDAAPAPAAAAALPSRPSGKWEPKRRVRAEACPEDFVSERQREEERECADDVSVILPHLCLSSYRGAGAKERLQNLGVTHILCLDAELKAKHPGTFIYKIIDLQDEEYADLLAQLPESLAFIQQARDSGGGTLVHCQRGRSRSASTVLAYLMLRGGQSLQAAWAQTHAARPMISPNNAFKRQLLRLQHMAQTGVDFQQHPLHVFHRAEMQLISTKPAAVVQNDLQLSVDPAEYAAVQQGGGGEGQVLRGLLCAKCGRVVASPLNLLWLGGELHNGPGTGPAASSDDHIPDAITELVHGAFSPVSEPGGLAPEAGVVHCPGCRTRIGSRQHCTSAVARAYEREPDSAAWQAAAGGLAAGAPEAMLPRWCAVIHRGRTRLAGVIPLPSAGTRSMLRIDAPSTQFSAEAGRAYESQR